MLCLSFTVLGQSKKDLSPLLFNEPIDSFIGNTEKVHKGLMFDEPDMVSYGVDENKQFVFTHYLPEHIEFLSYRGIYSGFAFRILDYKNQEEIRSFLHEKYNLKIVDRSAISTVYKYTGDSFEIELSAITENQFTKGMKGYLSVKTITFIQNYNVLDRKYSGKR
jgi:hypothetical protein